MKLVRKNQQSQEQTWDTKSHQRLISVYCAIKCELNSKTLPFRASCKYVICAHFIHESHGNELTESKIYHEKLLLEKNNNELIYASPPTLVLKHSQHAHGEILKRLVRNSGKVSLNFFPARRGRATSDVKNGKRNVCSFFILSPAMFNHTWCGWA